MTWLSKHFDVDCIFYYLIAIVIAVKAYSAPTADVPFHLFSALVFVIGAESRRIRTEIRKAARRGEPEA